MSEGHGEENHFVDPGHAHVGEPARDPLHASVQTPNLGPSAPPWMPPTYGNPGEYHADWFFQQSPSGCGPSAITQVIETQTGIHIDNWEMVVQEAHHLGIPLNPDNAKTGGLSSLTQAQQILQAFDIPSHVEYPPDEASALHSLEEALGQGRNVIVTAYAQDMWDSPTQVGYADHAVIVSAINYDTEPPTVTLSDSGVPNDFPGTAYGQTTGNEETIPLSAFLEAWSAPGQPGPHSESYAMLVTDNPATGTDEQASHIVDGMLYPEHVANITPGHSAAGSVLLPIVVLLGAGLTFGSVARHRDSNSPSPVVRPALGPAPA